MQHNAHNPHHRNIICFTAHFLPSKIISIAFPQIRQPICRKQKSAAILNTLEKKGYARRLQNPQDKRQVLVYITDAGKQDVKGKYEDVISRMAEFLELLGPEDSEEFIRIVRDAVLRNIGK